MFRIRPEDTHLAEEFKAKPYGHHSPALEAALDRLRLANPEGKPVLVCTRPGREWTLGFVQPNPPGVLLHPELRFESVEAAEWAVFKRRWRSVTGEELALT